MTDYIRFQVEDAQFEMEMEYAKNSSFVVQSIPHDYQVSVKDNGFENFLRNTVLSSSKHFVLLDANIWKVIFGEIDKCPENVFLIEALEDNKEIQTVLEFVNFMQQRGLTKGDNLFVVGGGITQDIGAFAAACYKRGVPWTFVPTTLLSMCDSCIGGKTGINYHGAKNQLALFSAPYEVLIFLDALQTLPEQHMLAGLGEILKLHATGGRHLVNSYIKMVVQGKVLSPKDLQPLILGSLHVKKLVIEYDEFEKQTRKVLNYGHTFGHVLESALQYAIPHGQAIALGMIIANRFGCQHGVSDLSFSNDVNALCADLVRGIKLPDISEDKMLSLLVQDKKVLGKELSLVVPGRDAGYWSFLKLKVDLSLVREALTMLRELEFQ